MCFYGLEKYLWKDIRQDFCGFVYYIRNNIEGIRDDLVLMISGESVEIKLQGYAATDTELSTKNQIYSAMVVYGLLTYDDGAVFIPNREMMDKIVSYSQSCLS